MCESGLDCSGLVGLDVCWMWVVTNNKTLWATQKKSPSSQNGLNVPVAGLVPFFKMTGKPNTVHVWNIIHNTQESFNPRKSIADV